MLDFALTRGSLLRAGRVLALPVAPAAAGKGRPTIGAGADALAALDVDGRAALAREEATGEAGQIVSIPVGRRGVDTVLLVGVGDGSVGALRMAAAAVVRRAKSSASLATTLAFGRDPESLRAVVEALGLASYAFSRRSKPSEDKLERATLVVDDVTAAQRAFDAAVATVRAVHLARDLANTPSLEKSPEWMAEQAAAVASDAGLDIEVWDAEALARDGFGGILGVGRGSVRPPRLVRLSYVPAAGVASVDSGTSSGGSDAHGVSAGRGDAPPHVVLVGKGITFDSGGLSLKPPDSMVAMKTDMSGSAAVLGAMSALRSLGVGCRVTALTPFAENMPGADATRPGDVLRHYGGRTTEVLNTDAEGRLVLADALAYAVSSLAPAPTVVIDIATLTGAATLGLGRRHGALFSTSAAVSDALVAAGAAGGELLWPMPLVHDYRSTLDSPIADARNIGDPATGFSGGAIVAALFLREFVGSVPWAHLDIAGPARAEADEHEVTKGATGFGTRTFLRYLESLS